VIRGDALQDLRIAVFGHEAWAGRRGWIREGVGLQPGVEGDLEFVAEPAHVQRSQFIAALVPGLDPCVARRDIQETLLASQGHELIGLDPESRSLRI
jgi:hypothetical protein